MPEHVIGVLWVLIELRGVTVEDRSAERDMVSRVAVTAERHVTTGDHHFVLPLSRLAEECDRLFVPESTSVIFELAVVTFMPIWRNDPLENFLDQVALLVRIEIRVDLWLGNVPVVGHKGS